MSSINPYQPPSSLSALDNAELANKPARRPIGVAILSILHALGSLAFGAILVFLVVSSSRGPTRGFPPLSILLFLGVPVVAFGLACGVGMWFGARWSWWLAAFYYVSMLMGESFQLVVLAPIKASSGSYDDAAMLAMRHGIRVFIFLALAYYIFRANVLRFFGLGSLRKPRAIGILVAVTIAVAFVIAILTIVVFISNRR